MSLPSQEPDFDGLHVAAFESRRADDLARLIERNHGIAHVSPSMREVALDENQASIDFANRIITGEVDVFIVMTGVGFKHLIRAIERHVDMQRFLNCLQDMTTVARGPKPVVAMKEFGITPTIKVPSPNTWREILSTLDQQLPVNQLTIAIQEYGKPNPSLVAGLEARGAHIQAIKVYRWDLPKIQNHWNKTSEPSWLAKLTS